MITRKNDSIYDAYLAHHGTLGMKWGHRRYQNEDGSYKPGAEGRYYTPTGKHQKETYKALKKAYKKNHDVVVGNKEFGDRFRSDIQRYITPDEIDKLEDSKNKANYYNFERKRNGMKGYEEAKGMPDPGYSLTEKGENDFWDAQDKDYEECKKVAQRILGEYGDKKISSKTTKTYADLGASYLQANIVGVTGWDELKLSRQKPTSKQFQQNKLENAKKNDKWDTQFLEMVQNKKIYNDQPKLLKEYEKYLNDPSNYRKYANKLEDE